MTDVDSSNTASPGTPTAPMSWCDHGFGPVGTPLACETLNERLAIATVPVRAGPPLAAIPIVTVPLPVPDAPLVTVSHVALLVAVHEQVLSAVTVVVASEASVVTDALAGDRA